MELGREQARNCHAVTHKNFLEVLRLALSSLRMVLRPVHLAYQPPANSTFISEQTSNQPTTLFSQNKPAPAINQHQPSATSQTNRLSVLKYKYWLTFSDHI
jgi:hypothetical protein